MIMQLILFSGQSRQDKAAGQQQRGPSQLGACITRKVCCTWLEPHSYSRLVRFAIDVLVQRLPLGIRFQV